MRKGDGSLYFFVNGIDFGCVATVVFVDVYGVVDLFGQCIQVIIVLGIEENIGVEIVCLMNGKSGLISCLYLC